MGQAIITNLMEEGKEKIVTIATFYDPFKAHVLRTKLESEGVACYLADGNLLPTYSFYSNEGGVKLKIRSSDVAVAKKILSAVDQL